MDNGEVAVGKNVTAQALGGETVPNLEVATVEDAFKKLGLEGAYSATINGDPAKMEDSVPDFAFVSFSPSIKGGSDGVPAPEATSVLPVGAFVHSLKRNNEEIKDDRAAAISEDTELVYRREIENIGISLKKLARQQEGMLDLSPTHADSLILAANFDSDSYVAKDIDLSLKIKKGVERLDVAKTRYRHLFGQG